MNFSNSAKVILSILIFSFTINSQWFQQNSEVTVQLNSVFFTDQNTGIAAGDSGKVLRTTDAGTTWNSNTVLSPSISYKSIYFYDQNTGYIAGSIIILGTSSDIEARIIKTTNGGQSWFSSLIDSNYTLMSVYFMNPNTGFAAGGYSALGPNSFLKTTNAGINWSLSSLGQRYLFDIKFKDAFTGYVTAYGFIYKSTDMGANWNPFTVIPNVSVYTSMNFIDANLGFMTGGNRPEQDSAGYIYRTVNGGNNWNVVYSDHKGLLNDVKFVSSNTGFVLGANDYYLPYTAPSRILKTTNSGNNWFIDTVFTDVIGLSSIFFTGTLTGYVVGSNGAILKTTTGGNPIGIVPISKDIPKQFSLSQNYPNPFNPVTTIKFDIPKESKVKISVFDILGNEIQTLVNENMRAGEYQVNWDASGYSSGVYFYKLQAEDFVGTKKMLLVK